MDSNKPPDDQSGDSLQEKSSGRPADQVAGLLTRTYRDEMQSVESLSIAVRYFSRFPAAALKFARCSADEARHVAVLASRLVELTGAVTSVPDRSAALDQMPGFKRDERGDLDDLVRFVSRVYADEHRAMSVYQTVADSLEADVTSRKIFRRLARDERSHIGSLGQVIAWLNDQGYGEAIRTALAEEGISAAGLDHTNKGETD